MNHREHAQEMAMRYAAMHPGSWPADLVGSPKQTDLAQLISWFQKDATPNAQPASQFLSDEQEPLSPGDQFKAEMEAQNGHVSPERAIQLAERVDKWDAPMLRAALQAIGIHNIRENPEDTLAELTEDQAKALEALV